MFKGVVKHNYSPHMARDGDLSLAVLQGVGPSPVGLYQPSVLGRLLPLHNDFA